MKGSLREASAAVIQSHTLGLTDEILKATCLAS